MLLPAPNSDTGGGGGGGGRGGGGGGRGGGGGGRGDIDAWAPAEGVKVERPAYSNAFGDRVGDMIGNSNSSVFNGAQEVLRGQLRDAIVQMAIGSGDTFLDSLMRR